MDTMTEDEIISYANSLSPEEVMLIVLKKQLYSGKWSNMVSDLKNRLQGKPYVFKLVNRINDDIDRIVRLSDFELQNRVDLSKYVELPFK